MIGVLRNKLTLLVATAVDDEAGGRHTTFTPGEEIWGAAERLSPVRDFSGEARRFLDRLSVEIRGPHPAAPGDRFRLGARNYEIVSVETVDERQRRIRLIGEEVLP